MRPFIGGRGRSSRRRNRIPPRRRSNSRARRCRPANIPGYRHPGDAAGAAAAGIASDPEVGSILAEAAGRPCDDRIVSLLLCFGLKVVGTVNSLAADTEGHTAGRTAAGGLLGNIVGQTSFCGAQVFS